MAKNTLTYFTKDLRAKPTSFQNSDGTTAKQIFDPSIEGSRVDAIIITSTDTVARTCILQINNGGTISALGHIAVPAGAGTDGSTSAVSGLNTGNLPWLKKDANGNPYINLNYGMNLEIYMQVAVTATKQVSITVLGANYDA
jgi:hypothetical protein